MTEKDGEKVAFCCDQCKEAYEKDPAKYKAKLEGAYSYQTMCPVMNELISPKAVVTLEDGRKIYLCCQECEEKLMANPAKYAPNLEKQHVKVDPEKMKAKTAG